MGLRDRLRALTKRADATPSVSAVTTPADLRTAKLGILDEYKSAIDGFVEGMLDDYIDRVSTGPVSTRPKEFNDPVWGTLVLTPEEVVILDSPIIQRLRRIKQLGVAHYVYPAAVHTRLEHSIGVVHQVDEMVNGLQGSGLELIDESRLRQTRRMLRLAALCHDIGHGAMSHVSEYALENNRRCDDVRGAFQRINRRSNKNQLSEIAAHYMVGSASFRRLLKVAAEKAALPPFPDACDLIQKLLVGTSVDNELVLIHEFISGPYDADKLDYLTRDAVMCGVPKVTDVPRLIRKLRATHVDSERLTDTLRRRVKDSPRGYVITGIARSGGRTLDELALARILMFDKVYRHQKVRAAEAMVFALIDRLADVLPGHPALIPYQFSDDELIALDDAAIENMVRSAGGTVGDEERVNIRVASDLARRLRERRLFGRALAFSAVMTDDSYRLEADHSSGLTELLDDAKKPAKRGKLVDEIAVATVDIAAAVGRSHQLEGYGDISAYLWLSPPKPAPKGTSSDTGHAHLVDDDGSILQVERDAAETTAWTDAYVATRDLGYLYCPQEIRDIAYIAAEYAIFLRYRVRMPNSMLSYAKQDLDHILDLKYALATYGWYDGKPREIAPPPRLFSTPAIGRMTATIVENLAGYSGPSQAKDLSKAAPTSTIHREQVLQFVAQFDTEDNIELALQMLQKIRVLGRTEARAAVTSFMNTHSEFEGASYCTLGEARDSSSVLTYFVGDVAEEYDMTQRSLVEALSIPDKPVLFIDDFAGTGRQTVDIVQAFLGVERTENLDERRESLNSGNADLLLHRKIGLVHVAGFDEAARNIDEKLRQAVGLDLTSYVHIGETELPFLSTLEAEPEALQSFTDRCRWIGGNILQEHNGKERPEDWIRGKELGYGNRGLLLTSTFNTPTATVTCLWKSRASDVSPWRALLTRRTKH